MNAKRFLSLSCATLVLTGVSQAQGADLCANAQVINGLGMFPFDNSTATTDGTPDPLCSFFNQDDIENDVWFSWVAPASAIYTLDTCNLTTVDTKIGIYDGSCAGALLACVDDSCNSFQTRITWNATMGNTYLIRLGNYPTLLGGPGMFDLREEAPIVNPANGNGYLVFDQPLSWNDANAAAQSYVIGGVTGHLATIADQAELDWMLANLTFDRPWIGLFHDTSDPNYSEPAGGWAWVTGEPTNFLNWSAGEPNNNSASGGAEDYAEMFGNGAWNDAELNHAQTTQYIVEFEGSSSGVGYCQGDGSASCPCFFIWGPGVGCQNTAGPGAGLTGSGNAQVSNDTFQMMVFGAPPQKAGLMVKGSNQIQNPAGDGLLCTAPQRRSQVQVTDASGETTYTIFDGMPFSGVANLSTPSYFQFWYRDPANTCGGGFNFTSAWEVTFIP